MAEEKAVSKIRAVTQEQTVSPDKKAVLISKLGVLKIPVLLLLVSVLAVGTAFAVSKVTSSDARTKHANVSKEDKKNAIGKFITLEAFTVNLAGGQNYLQTVVALEIDGKNLELENEIKERKPQINDAIITILSAKMIDEISDNDGREKLKVEIKKAVDSLLSYGKIKRVYFTTFIMQ